jgi:hypothetical protein
MSSMQRAIAIALDHLSADYSHCSGFVPQSRLWDAISDPQGEFSTQITANSLTFRAFLSALYGSRLSLEAFESVEDSATGECSVRLRSSSAIARLAKAGMRGSSRDIHARELDGLQRTVRELRSEVAALEARNQQISAVIDGMKAVLPASLRQAFDHLQEVQAFIGQVSGSLGESEADVHRIANALPP